MVKKHASRLASNLPSKLLHIVVTERSWTADTAKCAHPGHSWIDGNMNMANVMNVPLANFPINMACANVKTVQKDIQTLKISAPVTRAPWDMVGTKMDSLDIQKRWNTSAGHLVSVRMNLVGNT
jgi:hypothetical protein